MKHLILVVQGFAGFGLRSISVGRALSNALLIFVTIAALSTDDAGAMEGPGGGENDPFSAAGASGSASLFTGAATVNVPILIPPGRTHTTPDLKLGYSSQAGQSDVGLGWSFSIGVLSRSTRNGVPRCTGTHTENFRISLSDSSNELVKVSSDLFHMKVDEAYAEAIPNVAGNTWSLRTRDGLTYQFGGSAESRVHTGADVFFGDDPNTSPPNSLGCELTTAWHLTRIEDPNGNFLEVHYEKTSNTPIPVSIEYGGNQEVPIDHPFRVRVESELLPPGKPQLRSFRSGVDQQLQRRIKSIVVEARESAASEFAEIRRYDLQYDDLPARQEFLLTSISATGLPDRSFSYSTSTPTLVDGKSGHIPTDPILLSRQFPTGPILSIRDMNGDGLMDRVRVVNGQYRVSYGESLSENQFTSEEYTWTMPPDMPLLERIGAEDYGQDIYMVMDMDGDGKPDFVIRDPDEQTIKMYPGECITDAYDCGFSPQFEAWNNPGNLSLRFSVAWDGGGANIGGGRRTYRDVIDMNADGLPDLVRAQSIGLDVFLNTGDGFETAPTFLETGEDYLTYTSNPNTYTLGHETQLIDLNGDGLPDRVEAPRFHDWTSSTSRPGDGITTTYHRVPLEYYTVDLNDGLHGPYDLSTGPYLCPTSAGSEAITLCHGASGYTLPGGWAIVPAMSVRLHTGSGFTDRIYSPAPFLFNAAGTAPRLRATTVDNTAQRSFAHRDFIDMNGDGRVDWVAAGAPDGSLDTTWYVLFNQGDGRFGTDSLERISGAYLPSLGAPAINLGDVRSTSTIEPSWHHLGETYHYSSSTPIGLSEQYAHVFDLDGDGIPELVTSTGMTDDRWNLQKIVYEDDAHPHSKPLLLVEMDSGLGGLTNFRYRPTTDFISPSDGIPAMPFSTWVVTGIRRTDGLCDTRPDDWFRLSGNPCLSAGHEVVERIDYAEGLFDGATREFRGFGKVVVMDGPEEHAGERHVRFYQDEHLKGRIEVEEIYVGGVDLLSRTTYDWRTVDDGLRTQVFLQEQRIEESVLYSDEPVGTYQDKCVVHRNSILDLSGSADPLTRIHESCSMSCEGALSSDDLCEPAPVGKKHVQTLYASPIPNANHPVWGRPALIHTSYVDENSTLQVSGVTQYAYDGADTGIDRGNVSRERTLVSPSPETWLEKIIGHDNDDGAGVGNIVSVEIPVSGQQRGATTTEYDADFRLYPAIEALPTTTNRNGQAVQQRTLKIFDLRFGRSVETVGIHGRSAGDVSGAVYDDLGRPLCEYEPGTSCADGPGFRASVTYAYHEGEPDAQEPFDRLSWVEVRRREPNAPNGFLATRSYRDALGRERITTTEQFIVDPPSSTGPASMRTVVRRHLAYGPHGRVSKRFAAYAPDPSGPSLSPPPGTSSIQLNYSLNGNGSGAGFWDPTGRIWEITQHDLSTQRENYYGQVTQKIDAVGNHVLEFADEHGRLVRRKVFEGSTEIMTVEDAIYNGRDDVLRRWVGEDPSTEITSSYDLAGRLVERIDPDSGVWTATYDEASNKIFSNDPVHDQGIQTCFDELDRVVLECGRSSDVFDPGLCGAPDPECSVAYSYDYDEVSDGQDEDEGGPHSRGTNYGTGRLTSVEGPDSQHRFAYDVRGRVTQEIADIQGVIGVTTYRYFADVDRIMGMTYPDDEMVEYAYNPAGQPSKLTNRASASTWAATFVMNIRYDLLGRVLSVSRGNRTVDEYTYHGPDENFRVNEIRIGPPSFTDQITAGEYINIRYDDYDGNGRLLSIDDDLVTTGPLSLSADYAFDGAGRLESVEGPNPEEFEYDAIGNITSINDLAFSKTPGGSSSLGPHQLDRFGEAETMHWTMTFNESGQRTGKMRSDGFSSHSYGFDPFGRMRSLTVNGVAKTMGYDHTGTRVSETRNGVTRRFFGSHAESENGLVHKYYFIGETLIATRTDAAPSLSVSDEVAFEPIHLPPEAYWVLMFVASTLLLLPMGKSRVTIGLRISQGGALGSIILVGVVILPIAIGLGCVDTPSIRHYHLSQRSSPLAITTPSGELDRQYRYSAYGGVRRYDGLGEPVSIDPSSRREFTGYQTDPESELQYANARYYDPSQAQFLSLDPGEENASPYAYAAWDPIDFTDPSGEEGFSLAFLVFMALALAAVVVQAIITGVQTASWSNGFTALGIGVGTLFAGTISGAVLPGSLAALPGISQHLVEGALAVTGIGSSTYGATTVGDTASAVLAGISLALTLSGAAYAVSAASSSPSPNGPSPPPNAHTGGAAEPTGVQIAANGSNRSSFIEQMLIILRGSAEGRIIRDARLQNEMEIAALRGEATSKGTVRGRPIGDHNVTAFEVMSFTVDTMGNQSFNESVVTVEFTAKSAALPTKPALIGPGRQPFIRTVVTGPHPISCGSCSRFLLP
jgi:RHS repeat-associated protein